MRWKNSVRKWYEKYKRKEKNNIVMLNISFENTHKYYRIPILKMQIRR